MSENELFCSGHFSIILLEARSGSCTHKPIQPATASRAAEHRNFRRRPPPLSSSPSSLFVIFGGASSSSAGAAVSCGMGREGVRAGSPGLFAAPAAVGDEDVE